MNIYTFHIPSGTFEIESESVKSAWELAEFNFPREEITLIRIGNTTVGEPLEEYQPPDPEERYWKNVQSWNERHSVTDEDLW